MSKAFVLNEKISESSTTLVYKGYDTTLHRPVLVKLLQRHLLSNEQVRARFEREARALAAVHSENIVQVYELTEIEGTPAIIMEYVEGESLATLLERERKLPPESVKKIAVDILKGLVVVHAHGIIHRDIKPANIVLSNTGTAKLTDFGLAAVAHMPTVTLEGTILGTPAYMSPEQVRGERVDARSDLFSLGLTLLEARTGRRFCEGSTYAECIKKVMNFSLSYIDEVALHLLPEEKEFYTKLLTPNVDARFRSAEEALTHLGVYELPQIATQKENTKHIFFTLLVLFLLIGIGILSFISLNRTLPSSETKGVEESLDTSRRERIENDATIVQKNERKQEVAVPKELKREGTYRETTATVLGTVRVDSIPVTVICKPWGKVYLDDRYIGETPFSNPLYVKYGEHVLTFYHPYFVPIVRTLSITSVSNELTIEVDFMETAGYVFVNALPWAKIYVDEQYRETTPFAFPLIVTAGKRIFKFENPQYESITREITVPVHDTITLSIDFRTNVHSE